MHGSQGKQGDKVRVSSSGAARTAPCFISVLPDPCRPAEGGEDHGGYQVGPWRGEGSMGGWEDGRMKSATAVPSVQIMRKQVDQAWREGKGAYKTGCNPERDSSPSVRCFLLFFTLLSFGLQRHRHSLFSFFFHFFCSSRQCASQSLQRLRWSRPSPSPPPRSMPSSE
jgi:hypothetical protein